MADYGRILEDSYVEVPQRKTVTMRISPLGFVPERELYAKFSDGTEKQLTGPGTSTVSDEVFGPSWNGVTGIAPSKNVVYDKIITIGAGFGNTAFVRASGNDSTAVVGNYLMPFQTIGAAIAALGTLASSAIYIDAGTYQLNDANAPFGLKAPGSKYDIYCAAGCRIEYYGTYGMYAANGLEGTRGRIFGLGDFVNYSGTATKVVDGKSGYVFNWGFVNGTNLYQFNQILNEVTSGTIGLIRIGNWGAVGNATINVETRAYSRTGIVFYADVSSSCRMEGKGTYDSVGDFLPPTGNYTLRIENVGRFTVTPDVRITARGTLFGNSNTRCIVIRNTTNSLIQFFSPDVTCLQAPAGYKLIEIEAVPGGGIMNNLTFRGGTYRNRQTTSQTSDGFSFYSDFNCSFKIIDVYSEKNSGGAGVITNLIGTGNGFMVEPNII